MNEIITVNYDNEQPTVSARELHDFLEVGADFRHWFPRMCEYGFEQGRDFNPVKFDRLQYEGNREVRRTVDDAAITIDMAKELCMLQRNDKGKQARQYFIEVEKRSLAAIPTGSNLLALAVILCPDYVAHIGVAKRCFAIRLVENPHSPRVRCARKQQAKRADKAHGAQFHRFDPLSFAGWRQSM